MKITDVTLLSLLASVCFSLPVHAQGDDKEPPAVVSLDELDKLKKQVGELQKALFEAKKKYGDALSAYKDPCARVKDGSCPDGSCGSSNEAFEQRSKAFELHKWTQTKKGISDGFKDYEKGGDPPTYFPFSLRQSVLSAEDMENPATMTWLHNGNGADSYSVDAAFTLDPALPGWALDSSKPFELAPFVEYHRNSNASALNDTLITGIRWGAVHTSADSLWSDLYEHLNFIGGWRRDRVNEGSSAFGRLEWAPTPKCLTLATFNSPTKQKQARLRFLPSVALDWRHTYDGVSPAFEGDNLFLHGGVDMEYLPAFLSDRLVLKAGYDVWHYLSRTQSVAFARDTLHYFKASADFFIDGLPPGPAAEGSPDRDGHFAVSLIFTHGDNPDTGALDEDQLALSFRVYF